MCMYKFCPPLWTLKTALANFMSTLSDKSISKTHTNLYLVLIHCLQTFERFFVNYYSLLCFTSYVPTCKLILYKRIQTRRLWYRKQTQLVELYSSRKNQTSKGRLKKIHCSPTSRRFLLFCVLDMLQICWSCPTIL